MTQDIRTINEEKIREANSKSIKIHLVKTNGEWRNGFVVETSAEFFIFEDVINGKDPIFFSELKRVEPYIEEEE